MEVTTPTGGGLAQHNEAAAATEATTLTGGGGAMETAAQWSRGQKPDRAGGISLWWLLETELKRGHGGGESRQWLWRSGVEEVLQIRPSWLDEEEATDLRRNCNDNAGLTPKRQSRWRPWQRSALRRDQW